MAKSKKNIKEQKLRKRVIATVCIVLVLVFVAVMLYNFSPKFKEQVHLLLNDNAFGANNNGNNSSENSSNSTSNVIQTQIAGEGDLVLHMVDVGQGDALIIQFPDAKTMLIDAGPDPEQMSNGGDTDKDNNLTTYIDSLGITKFDYVVATHQDEDHIGMMETIFYNYEVDYAYRPYVYSQYTSDKYPVLPTDFNLGSLSGKKSTSLAYYRYLKYMYDEEGCEWEFFNKDSDFTLSFEDEDKKVYNCTFDFLTPTSDVANISYSNENSYSPLIMLTYANRKILLTGDATSATEKEMLDFYPANSIDYDIDILKVGHHGSDTSTSDALFEKIKPEYAFISCGQDNKYSHPHQSTMDKLKDFGSIVYRTDQDGSCYVKISKDGEMDFFAEKLNGSLTDFSAMYDYPER